MEIASYRIFARRWPRAGGSERDGFDEVGRGHNRVVGLGDGPSDDQQIGPGRLRPSGQYGVGIAGKIAGAALVRVATRSVPGAIVVTSGLVAKKLYDRRRARKGKGEGNQASATGQNTKPKA